MLPKRTITGGGRYLRRRIICRCGSSGSTACFEVHSYQYSDTGVYDKAFEEIRAKGVKNLIIDLRHNTGGYPDRRKTDDLSGGRAFSDGGGGVDECGGPGEGQVCAVF
ncbi:S41 family peptidase [Puia sp. P3]|uniref:S41 family peptidase n=1 Tax=Puia sp. P3 TaxID=3423952 RepID=UPI003D673ECD